MTHSPCPECSVVCCLLLTSRNSQDFIHATHTWLIVFPMLTGSFVLQCLDFRIGWKEIYRIPTFEGKHNREPRIFDGKTQWFSKFPVNIFPWTNLFFDQDQFFQKASEFARVRGLPRIYVSCNSGARVGLVEELKPLFKVPKRVKKRGLAWLGLWENLGKNFNPNRFWAVSPSEIIEILKFWINCTSCSDTPKYLVLIRVGPHQKWW